MIVAANRCDIGAIPQRRMMLETATTIEEIRKVEKLSQLFCEFVKKATLARQDINSAGCLFLDARRKIGDMLKEMKDRGELAEPGRRTQI